MLNSQIIVNATFIYDNGSEYDLIDYDLSDTFDSVTIVKFIPAVIVYSLTFFFGFIGLLIWNCYFFFF